MDMDLFFEIRVALQELADPERAPDMQRYMKSKLPFYGIPTPVRRKTCRAIFKRYTSWNFEKWNKSILTIWRKGEYREERYAAIDLLSWTPYSKYHKWEALPMIEELIVSGAWWDYCDHIAGVLGNILRVEPERMRALMMTWAVDDNMWKRRSSILCQLRFKNNLDFVFLQQCIKPSLESKEFFLRKAIGWSLRDYAWTNPLDVQRYVKENSDRLSALSKREVLKNMHKLL